MNSRPPIAPSDPPVPARPAEAPPCPEPIARPEPGAPEYAPPAPDRYFPDEAPLEAPDPD